MIISNKLLEKFFSVNNLDNRTTKRPREKTPLPGTASGPPVLLLLTLSSQVPTFFASSIRMPNFSVVSVVVKIEITFLISHAFPNANNANGNGNAMPRRWRTVIFYLITRPWTLLKVDSN